MQNWEPYKTSLKSSNKLKKTNTKNSTQFLITLLVATLVIILDQITKLLASQYLSKQSIKLLGPLKLKLEYNSGIAFSLLSGHAVIIDITIAIVCIVLIYYAIVSRSLLMNCSFGLILGGALSNFADRLLRSDHQVIDFIYTGFWPTFNLADTSIVIGCALLVIKLIKTDNEKNNSSP
jgi:signal peptidase II